MLGSLVDRLVVTADVLFRLTANAAAAQYRRQPPYLAYHTVADIDIPALKKHKAVARAVETRTSDDFAVLQDLPSGRRQYGRSFPLIPTFDALSYFRIDYSGARERDSLAHVTTYAPITFAPPHPASPGVAVVATTLRNYYAHYAEDSTDTKAHLLMDPLKALTQGNPSDFYLHDLYIDTATDLPLRVTYTGRDDIEFTIDYAVVEDHWLVSHASYARTFFGPFRIGRTSLTVDVVFDNFAFPQTPADRTLLTAPPVPPPAQSSKRSNASVTPA